jgi:hypothetical protein
MKGRFIALHAQTHLPSQIVGAGLDRLAVGQSLHKLQDQYGKHPCGFFGGAPIVCTIHRFEVRAQFQQFGNNRISEKAEPFGWSEFEQLGKLNVGIEQAPLIVDAWKAHGDKLAC